MESIQPTKLARLFSIHPIDSDLFQDRNANGQSSRTQRHPRSTGFHGGSLEVPCFSRQVRASVEKASAESDGEPEKNSCPDRLFTILN